MPIVDLSVVFPGLQKTPVWVPFALSFTLILAYLLYHVVQAGLFRKLQVKQSVLVSSENHLCTISGTLTRSCATYSTVRSLSNGFPHS